MPAPLLATGAGRFVAGWAAANLLQPVIGGQGIVGQLFNPNIVTPPPPGGAGDIGRFNAGLYKIGVQVLAPSDKDMKALDDFFESYGYNVQRFGEVNLNVRSGSFTYIKTRDAQVTAANQETVNQMSAMLNSGIKFWSADEIGG